MSDKKTLESQHTEAPRSATASVKSANGFYWLFTMRESTGKELIEDIEAFEKVVLARGWTPVEPRQGGGFPAKPRLPEKPCPIPGHDPLKQRTGKDGKARWSHSRGTYPNLEWCNGFGFPGERPQQVIPVSGDEPPERDITDEF